MTIDTINELNALSKLFKFVKFESTDADTVFFCASPLINSVFVKTVLSLHKEMGNPIPEWGYIEQAPDRLQIIECKLQNYYIQLKDTTQLKKVIEECIFPYAYREETITRMMDKLLKL